MRLGFVGTFGVAAGLASLVGFALIASGGVLLLPLAFPFGSISVIGWVVTKPPRPDLASAGAILGLVPVLAIAAGIAIWNLR